jgi:acyl-CoA dehydrogenase
MATQNLIDLNTLSPKFKDLYAKAKDFVEVKQIENIRIKAY